MTFINLPLISRISINNNRLVVGLNIITSSFEGTGYKDDDDRREVWRKLQTVSWLEQCLCNMIDNGKIAEVELKGFAKLKQVLTR